LGRHELIEIALCSLRWHLPVIINLRKHREALKSSRKLASEVGNGFNKNTPGCALVLLINCVPAAATALKTTAKW
jgi:hypothetical protein